MFRKISFTYLIILATLFSLMSLSLVSTEKLRGYTIAVLAPFWEILSEWKQGVMSPFIETTDETHSREYQRLVLENRLLAEEITRLQDLFQQEYLLYSQLTDFQNQTQANLKADHHANELKALFQMQLESVAARVIYRSAATWSSSLWIDVGKEDNSALGSDLIAKNSPVVVGGSVVGIIDYVGAHQSRVRLITDSGLNPSVRVARGAPKTRLLNENIDSLLYLLTGQDKYRHLIKELKVLREQQVQSAPLYLAKGILRGGSLPLWRKEKEILYGQGFNYDFEDEEGPARDLRTGLPVSMHKQNYAIPILQEKDVLVTTGMDGVFPPGLFVGIISKIHLLKEGDYYYELEARPCVENLEDLTYVSVLAPVGYDSKDLPAIIGR